MSEITYRVDEAVAWLTINRPEARNALNRAVRDGLRASFERFADDDEAQVLVLTATGDEAFSAGGDLKEMADTGLKIPPKDFVPHLGFNIHVDKPVIAAVNGIAFGGGFLLAQMCDLCVAADHACFGITEPRWGRGAPWAAPLPWLIPPRVALEILMTAEPISAQRAYELGLVNRVVPGSDCNRLRAHCTPRSRSRRRSAWAVVRCSWRSDRSSAASARAVASPSGCAASWTRSATRVHERRSSTVSDACKHPSWSSVAAAASSSDTSLRAVVVLRSCEQSLTSCYRVSIQEHPA